MTFETKETTIRELLVDIITSLDGDASAEGWPGWRAICGISAGSTVPSPEQRLFVRGNGSGQDR